MLEEVQRLVNSVTHWTLAKVLPVFICQTIGATASWHTCAILAIYIERQVINHAHKTQIVIITVWGNCH